VDSSRLTRREFVATSALAATGLAAACAHPASGLLSGGEVPLYVGTYTEGKRRQGVHLLRMRRDDGALRLVGAYDVGPEPSFLALHPNGRVLYAVNEVAEFGGRASGAVGAFAIDRSGALTALGERRATGGGAPCYASVDRTGRVLLVANYTGGNVAAFPIGEQGALGEAAAVRQHEGTGPRTDRQEHAHAHCILPDPTNRWAIAADLGADRLMVYRLDERTAALSPSSAVEARRGAGPRHLAWSADGRTLYVANELDLTLGIWRWDATAGTLARVETLVLLPKAAPENTTAADLHLSPSGRHLYASVRGVDQIVVFSLDAESGQASRVQQIASGGSSPRNFAIDPSGRFLLAANQRSNSIAVFRIDARTGTLEPTGQRVEVPAPVCVRFA
jgi:6-phosphogluconolactonase